METKHELCSSGLKLNYKDLLQTAEIAMAYAKDSLHRNLGRWDALDIHNLPGVAYSDSMLRDAKALAQASETLYYLVQGQDRETKTIVER